MTTPMDASFWTVQCWGTRLPARRTAAIERGMAFALAMCWAQRTLRSMLS
jgi:hypothetical protein